MDSDVRDPNRISPLILDSKKWGRDDGAHCLPSISQINTLREGKICECVKNIQKFLYTYTVGSCLFDSAMFCLLRSNYFEMIIPYIDGPRLRASVYAFALTSLTTEGDDTLSDMDDYYIMSRNMLTNTEQGVMCDDEMRVIQENEPSNTMFYTCKKTLLSMQWNLIYSC